MLYDFIIAGGGPAAIKEAKKLSSLNYSVLMISDMFGGIMHVMCNEKLQSYCNELSLPSDDIKLKDYISENVFTPTGYEYTKYVSDLIEKEVNVKKEIGFVSHIRKSNNVFFCDVLDKKISKTYRSKNFVIATGLKSNEVPSYMTGMNYMTCLKAYIFFKKENYHLFENKKVVIVGSGNSAFQLARIVSTYEIEVTILANSYIGLFPIETNNKFSLRAQSQLTIERIWKSQTEDGLKRLNFYIYNKINKNKNNITVEIKKQDNEVHISKVSYLNIDDEDTNVKNISFSKEDTIFISATGTIPNIPNNDFGLHFNDKCNNLDLEQKIKGLYMAGSVNGSRSINTMRETDYEL